MSLFGSGYAVERKKYNWINRGIDRLCLSLPRLNINPMSFIDPQSKAAQINFCAAFSVFKGAGSIGYLIEKLGKGIKLVGKIIKNFGVSIVEFSMNFDLN